MGAALQRRTLRIEYKMKTEIYHFGDMMLKLVEKDGKLIAEWFKRNRIWKRKAR